MSVCMGVSVCLRVHETVSCVGVDVSVCVGTGVPANGRECTCGCPLYQAE